MEGYNMQQKVESVSQSSFLGSVWELLGGLTGGLTGLLPDVGSTGYLDYVTPEEVAYELITVGLDPNGRRFIALCGKIGYDGNVAVVVLHERYQDNRSEWVSAGKHSMLGGRPIDAELEGFFMRLIAGQPAVYRGCEYTL